MMAKYSIYFATILRHKIYEKAFREMTNLTFPYMIQRLCDEAGVPEILGVDERVCELANVQTKSMKDLEYPRLPKKPRESAAVPQTQDKGSSVSKELGVSQGGNMGVIVDIEIGNQRENPNSCTYGNMTPSTSLSGPTSISEPVGVSLEPTRPSNITHAAGMITIYLEFLQILVCSIRASDTPLRVFETEITTLFKKKRLGVQTRFKQVETRWKAAQIEALSDLRFDFQACIVEFKRQVIS